MVRLQSWTQPCFNIDCGSVVTRPREEVDCGWCVLSLLEELREVDDALQLIVVVVLLRNLIPRTTDPSLRHDRKQTLADIPYVNY